MHLSCVIGYFMLALYSRGSSSAESEPTPERRLGWVKSKKAEAGRPHAASNTLRGYSSVLSRLTDAQRKSLVSEMLKPTSKTCTAHAGSPSQDNGNHFRWAFLIQTGGARRQLVMAQLAASLSPYRRVVVSQDPLFSDVTVGQHSPLPQGGPPPPAPPVTQTWGGGFGQKILAGIACVQLSLNNSFDFLAVLDDDTAVRPHALDRALFEHFSGLTAATTTTTGGATSATTVDPSTPLMMGSDLRVLDNSSSSSSSSSGNGELLRLSSEAASVAAIGRGHFHGGRGTILSRGAVELLTTTAPRQAVRENTAASKLKRGFPTNSGSGQTDATTKVECDSRWTPVFDHTIDEIPEAASSPSHPAGATPLGSTNQKAVNQEQRNEPSRIYDAQLQPQQHGHRAVHRLGNEGQCLTALEADQLPGRTEAHSEFNRAHGVDSHLGVCSKCLLCPWHGYRQAGRTQKATEMERAFGFGNCTGSGNFSAPCNPGDTAIAACLKALGVAPTLVPGLKEGFLHLNNERRILELFKKKQLDFAKGDVPAARFINRDGGTTPNSGTSRPGTSDGHQQGAAGRRRRSGRRRSPPTRVS